jgi:hypothetical protein
MGDVGPERELQLEVVLQRVPQALIVETALASFLSPDASERLEGALGRRLVKGQTLADEISQEIAPHVETTNQTGDLT